MNQKNPQDERTPTTTITTIESSRFFENSASNHSPSQNKPRQKQTLRLRRRRGRLLRLLLALALLDLLELLDGVDEVDHVLLVGGGEDPRRVLQPVARGQPRDGRRHAA